MQNLEIRKQIEKIQRLITKTKSLPENDSELLGHWGRYLCILVAGLLENAISAIYYDFVHKSSSPHVRNYALIQLNKISNPKADRFLEIAGAFKEEWRTELTLLYANDAELKTAIDTIMNNRHQIAHGKDTGISVGTVTRYFEKSIEVLEFIETQCTR